jgi:hypothetical protein
VAVPNKAVIKIVPFNQLNKEAFIKGKVRGKDKELEARLFDHMFEIILDQDYERIYMFREYDTN